MDPAAMTIDELIAASAALQDGLFDRLAKITAQAAEHGVSVTVNLDGQLIALDLSDEALRLGAARLAAEIYRLTLQAAGSALAEGIEALEPVAGDALMELLVPDFPDTPEPLPALEDFSEVESWALPR
jgi:hypothetical protein